MPPRTALPSDDLYRRLGVPHDASHEAIELAWRGLLRRHHPDIAGPDGLEVAKRINVAHDWLSDPELRQRYDQERTHGIRGGRPPRAGTTAPSRGDVVRQTVHRPPTTAELVAAVVERVGRLSTDELDRLALAEPAPIAFLATLRQFVAPDLEATLDAAERAARDGLPPAARRVIAIRDAVVGRLADVVLGDVLEELLGEPAGGRARERLTRGWDAAIGQPRYGPATATIERLLERLGGLNLTEVRALAATGARERLGDPPWPIATSPDEDDALRVSVELAVADVSIALSRTYGAADRTMTSARRAAGRVAHLLVLRHAFPVAAFERHAAPWIETLIPPVAPRGSPVRRSAAGSR